MRTALYAGSFDPPTNGHPEVIEAALGMADRLVVAVGAHATKSPLLSVEERCALLEAVAAALPSAGEGKVQVRSFSGLAVDFAREVGATLLVRGVRDADDLADEMRLAGMNRTLAPEIATVFVPARAESRHISATLVRQIAALGGDVSPFVPRAVAERLRLR